MGFIFLFWSWIFEKSSNFLTAEYKNASNLLILWQTACIESFLPIGWRTFIWWKNPPKYCTILVGLRDGGILQIFYSRAVIQRTIVDSTAFLETAWWKRLRFVHIQLACQRSRRFRGIFAWSGSELWTLFKYKRSKLKRQNSIAVDVLSRPIQWYHSQADLIWADVTFKYT